MQYLLYAGITDEDVNKGKSLRDNPTLKIRCRTNGNEVSIKELIGKTFKIVKETTDSLIIEII